METKTVFLLQSTKDAIETLKINFEGCENFKVVGAESQADVAVEQICSLCPDFVISELVLSGSDGISVIKQLKERGVKSKIIVISALCAEEVIAKTVGAGADYFLAKPLNFNSLIERLNGFDKEDKRDKKRNSLEEKISNIFINVGIPPHIKGYSFLREGVKMVVDNPLIINNITKQLYPSIGEKYQTSPSKVERAIRHAIEVAWNRGRIDYINNILGVRAYVGAEKPTNGEFIALVADKMLLERA